jgi:hypothetical protein
MRRAGAEENPLKGRWEEIKRRSNGRLVSFAPRASIASIYHHHRFSASKVALSNLRHALDEDTEATGANEPEAA